MEKRILPVMFMALSVLVASAKAPSDPVLMTVNGVDVPLSEFEYLYHKNNAQQARPQSLDEYVDMFVTYKLKVADAKVAGIDTTQAFVREFDGYRNELAQPYLRDTTVENALVAEAYSHMLRNVDTDHIMLPLRDDQKVVADSLRAALDAGADFYDIAKKHSVDPSCHYNGGHIGWVAAGVYPYEFEKMVYETPVGKISPVFSTPYGYHIVRVNALRDNPGEVLVSHILKRFGQQRTPEDDAVVKHRIDSIYAALLAPDVDFAAVAQSESEDPGSAQNGGQLPWFGSGRMVPEFEKVAFALADGEVSEPFASPFGYHIIKRIDSRGVASFENAKASILNAINRDYRASMPRQACIDRLSAEYGARVESRGVDFMLDAVKASGAYDSATAAAFARCAEPLLVVGDSVVTVADFIAANPVYGDTRYPQVAETIERNVKEGLGSTVLQYESNRLERKYPDFRNLVREYRDGMMLFEISNINVWNRSANDKSGLEDYFRANRDKYRWDAPRYKGFVIYAVSDSVAEAVDTYLKSNDVCADSVSVELRRVFPRQIKVDKVIMQKGDNKVVDAIAFGGPAPDLSEAKRWKAYITYMGHVLDAPEEAADVRGAVTSDYQNYLEKQWVDALRSRYPVKINKKVLKKVK